MASERSIRQAGLDNIRQHRIGDTDGFTPEQAEDLGFTVHPDDLEHIIENSKTGNETADSQAETSRREKAGASAGQTICGDCAEVIPCQHVGIGRNGKPYTRGY